MTVKSVLLSTQPPGVLTAIRPLVAPAGTTAVIEVPVPAENTLDSVPLKVWAARS